MNLPLANGEFALVDDEDFESLSQFNWHLSRGYPYRTIYLGNYATSSQSLHEMLVGRPPVGMVTDHINGDPLDNRRQNLRFVNRRLNRMNTNLLHRVHQYRPGKWRVRFVLDDGKRISVNGIEDEAEARSIAALLKGALIYHELTKGSNFGLR